MKLSYSIQPKVMNNFRHFFVDLLPNSQIGASGNIIFPQKLLVNVTFIEQPFMSKMQVEVDTHSELCISAKSACINIIISCLHQNYL